LISRSVKGSRIESMWLVWPARLKQVVLFPDEVLHAVLVPDVEIFTRTGPRSLDVEEVAAVFGDQTVYQDHLRLEVPRGGRQDWIR